MFFSLVHDNNDVENVIAVHNIFFLAKMWQYLKAKQMTVSLLIDYFPTLKENRLVLLTVMYYQKKILVVVIFVVIVSLSSSLSSSSSSSSLSHLR